MEFLQQFTEIQIIGIILVILIFGGFLWKVAKRLFALLLIVLLVILGVYFVNPELLYDWFGKENVQKVEQQVEDKTTELKKETKEKSTKILND